ncbi:16S rRNA (cytosine(1402)-N(4))-methyltransferase RsmH [Flagellimonas allohymeniacidonis]|uniref:Ribosomal RNA small subunit methyltransferase H n=1 Tax=Flagellimonas allohymeniacidonis TaxID=2517819 RepID=A0A4Q8QBU7_9FLAO|nr:16S rRNA (cytosine(1402)-N(4))-methyltransferase RsmH [Allomuricauda hymeniacidonis]TAI46877.1 16S rRNA (cytosine(1402)-N(4))-methyltransferase RsmH [Allomuricauda hymeniacidonis]
MTREYHNPVLLQESVDGLNIKHDGVYVDVTFGGGGHSNEILKRLGENGKLFAFDQDEDALVNAIDDARFQLINQNFRYLNQFLKFYGIHEVDGILADFGVSSHQFDKAERGFSIRFDADLDMRMNQSHDLSAYEVVNTYPQDDLAGVLFHYGELRKARPIAEMIVQSRKSEPIRTTQQLKQILAPFLPKGKENKVLAQIYQAIRIEVNQEIEVLKEFLLQVPKILKKGGRLSVISYHSLEDRLVKRFIRDGKFEGAAEKDFFGNVDVPLKKIGGLVVPSAEEIAGNSRARSAKLRVAERI